MNIKTNQGEIIIIIKIPYGQEYIDLDVTIPHEIIAPASAKAGNESEIIAQALEFPIGMESFATFSRKSDKLLVLVNDATRPTPTSKVLKELYPFLRDHPDVKFLIATGAHRGPTEDELRYIFGDLLDEFRGRIHVHDALKDEDMVFLGRSSNGTEMYLNRLITETKNVLVIGSVEPHYFAGYTGGRKSFLPGVAAYRTIEMNHMHALSEKAAPLALKGNPVAEDMEDAMKVLKDLHIFSIQTVLTADHGLYAMVAGDLKLSFELAVEKANEVFCTPCRRRGNIVLTVAPYPMDIDLYQSQKALENGKLALEKDGIIILVSKCRDGIGDDTFLKLLCCDRTSEEVMQKIAEEYKLGYHKAARIVQTGMHAQMWAVSDLDARILEMARLKPHTNLQETFDIAITTTRAKGKEPYAVILPQGSLTVPLIK
ncbi:nickel-dependent lactate racemase [Methanomethylovorans sp.]|uniref:nickel-dependent lactate racemase n=1 Tax=Methanomethylovorans sp. TaxID=2758717 RepID=UPI00345E60DF